MAIEVECDFCGWELEEPGGLLFDPPKLLTVGQAKDSDESTQETLSRKRHICVKCMGEVEALGEQIDSRVKCYLVINGLTSNSWRREISYEAVVRLAGMSGTPSMTCKPRGKEGFVVVPGDTIRLTSKEMVFNVAHTDNA